MIQLGPKAVFELLLDLLELFGVLDHVHVSEHAHDARKTVHLANVQELERFHFEAETGIDQEQHEIGYFGRVDHRVDVIAAFVERQASLLAGHHRYWTSDVVELLTRVIADEILDECRLAHFGRANDRDEYWWWFGCTSVNFGHTQTLCFYVLCSM